jgi:hypothetical protein
MAGISKSQISRLCAEIDERVQTFLDRPLEGDWPYLWIDATYVKVREAGRIVSVAVTIAVAVNTDGRREVLGIAIGASEAETFWVEFLRKLKRRGRVGRVILARCGHEWSVRRARYTTPETIAPMRDDLTSCCPPWRHEPERPDPPQRSRPPNSYTTSKDTTDARLGRRRTGMTGASRPRR